MKPIQIAAALLSLAALPAHAQNWDCDVDDYITKPIGIEEAWAENAGYLFTQVSHQQPAGITMAPEIEARLGERNGLELDLPAYSSGFPLGRAPGAFGPLAAGLKLGMVHTCDMSRGRATLLTFEVEGQYWANPRPQVLPGVGDSATAQLLWAQLGYPWFTEGELGYTQRIGPGAASGWFVNASVGRALAPSWSAQLEVELDNQAVQDDGRRGMQGFVMPQIAYHATPVWLIALGEQASLQQGDGHPQWSTWLMLEREF